MLEVLQILEAEVYLREDTRVAQQAEAVLAKDEYRRDAKKLSGRQSVLEDRIAKVIDRIRELKDGAAEFGKEIQLLTAVGVVMEETAGILARPETGSPAIAAETEIIEMLLQSKRINPKGGGGGGSSPGGGGGGTATDSALALLGKGVNKDEVPSQDEVTQAVGESGPVLPEEFRAGLDEYFNRLENRGGS